MRRRAVLLLPAAIVAAGCHRGDAGTSSAAAGSSTSATIPAAAAARAGSGAPARSASPSGSFLASTAMQTWVYERPDAASRKLGYLRAGAVLATAAKPAGYAGCPGGFYPVPPAGFVCSGPTATLDVQDEIVRASTRRPNPDARMPYMYGIARSPAPLYTRLPTEKDLADVEPDLKKHLARWLVDETNGAPYGQDVWMDGRPGAPPDPREALAAKTTETDRIPWFLAGGRQVPNLSGLVKGRDLVYVGRAKRHTGLAFVDSLLYEGRRYDVTTDLLVVPADRFRPIHGSAFHGYELPKDIDFPFALVRRDKARRHRFDAKKNKLVDAGALEYRSAVKLTGKQSFFRGRLHYEADDGTWISDQDASRLDPPKRMPGWGTAGEKWIDINITKQTLVAFEGTKAVFATLVSTGEAGLADPETTKSTARGIFRIHTKHVSATMDSNVVGEEFELRDIPYVQYFKDGYALHAAYWHDSFGTPRSHGCVNLAPEDARRLFYWTEPAVPPGWHGVMKALTGTVVFVHP